MIVALAGQLDTVNVTVIVICICCPGVSVQPVEGLKVEYAPLSFCAIEKLVYPWLFCVNVSWHTQGFPALCWQSVSPLILFRLAV
jgi:hypothetical protein